ncbi:MAG: hypothetical protein N3B11_06165 [Coriobacteriia bacterium]|nr:hypothetical protein [Coriobacteriia bacterium]
MASPHRVLARSAALLLSVALLAGAAGCSSGGSSGDAVKSGSPDGGGSSAGAMATAADLAAALKRDHAAADWYADITKVTDTTVLGAPSIVVHTTWKLAGETDAAVFDEVNTKRSALQAALEAYDFDGTVNLFVQQADGALEFLISSGAKALRFDEAFALPPAPKTPAELKDWLAKVYGPGGVVKLGPDEDWYGRIKSIGSGERSGHAAEVQTSLPSVTDPRLSIIGFAIASSRTPMLQDGIWIAAVDGSGSSGSSGGGIPFLYPAK